MSIMTTFTRRSLARNKVRTAVTVAGIALAAALLTAVLTSVGSLGDFMLRNELAVSGSWSASGWSWDEDAPARMEEDPQIADSASMQDAGVVELSSDLAKYTGSMLAVVNAEGDIGRICAVHPAEGRLPQQPGEIMLPMRFKDSQEYSDGPCEIGSAVTFELCTRMIDGNPVSSSGLVEGVAGTVMGDAEMDLVAQRTQTYTVVGFYELPNWTLQTSVGLAAVTMGDDGADGAVRTFAVIDDPQSEQHVRQVMAPYTLSGDDAIIHYSLLRHQGVFDGRLIWDTFGMMAVVLSAVIILACVSLIYNAFGISIAQRKRQFGLLASIGASKRQIRASVFYEAALMAAAGIPLGVLAGLGGTAAVLSWMAPMIERVLAYDVPFAMHVNPGVIAAVALLTLLTVVASAWVPAIRAGRSTAMEAIRANSDVRPVDARKAAAAAASGKGAAYDAQRLLKPKGLSFARLFGVPGEIARLNRKRGRGSGTAASVSLAIAVILLMAAGSFSTYLRTANDVTGGNPADYDIGFYSGAGESLEQLEALYADLSEVDGVTGRGWYARSSFVFRVPDSMASAAMNDSGFAEMVDRVDGGYLSLGALAVLDDASFDAYAAECGLDAQDFGQGEFKGIAVRSSVARGGEQYLFSQLLDAPGSMGAIYGGSQPGFLTFSSDSSGLVAFVEKGSEADRKGSTAMDGGASIVPIDQVSMLEVPLEIAGLADKEAAIMGGSVPYELTVVVPLRAVSGNGLLQEPGFFDAPGFSACFDAEDHQRAATDLAETGRRIIGAEVGVSDLAASADDGRILVLIVDVFTMLFTGILTLIAIANVFNTVTNSLILRRREFAVMRSVGMGNSQFRRMIACECLGYGVRGLVPGLVISVGVSGLLYMSMAISFQGLPFTLPWSHMAAAAVLVAAAMAVSVIYGLHRCRMDSVVEALREDAV